MQLANTSARCLRSFAASIAWVELFALIYLFACDTYPYSADDSLSLFVALIVQSVFVLLAACSHAGLLLSLFIHTIVTIYVIYVDFTTDFNAVDSANDLKKLPTLVTASFLSFVYSIFAVTVLYSLPKKSATESSTPHPVVAHNVKSPLLQSETKEDIGRSLMADDDNTTDVSEIVVNSPGAILCLPIRVSCCLTFMTLLLPLGLILSSFRACYQRCKKGTASAILHLPSQIDKPMGGYACQMVFNTSFDVDKLRQITVALSEECGIDEAYVRVDLEEEPPHGDFPKKSGPMKSNHYVGEGSGRKYFVQSIPFFYYFLRTNKYESETLTTDN